MRRLVLRTVVGLLIASLPAATVFVVDLARFRPFSLNLFYEKMFVAYLLDGPELMTSVGFAEQFGYRRRNAHLSDASVAKAERDFARWHRYLDDLRGYDPARQTAAQRLSTRVLTWFIESRLEGERFRFHDYPVNPFFGVQSRTPGFMINQHRIDDARGAEDDLARLGEFGRKFDQVQEGLALRESKGVVPPRFVIERVPVEMRGFAARPAAESPLCENFARKLERLADVDAAKKAGLERSRSSTSRSTAGSQTGCERNLERRAPQPSACNPTRLPSLSVMCAK